MTDPFKPGQFYTRPQIHAVVGGSVQSWMPAVDGRVVALCLLADDQPDAPRVVLVGSGRGIETTADLLVDQDTPVPTFVKQAANQWEYVGRFVVAESSDDFDTIDLYSKIAGRNDITRVLKMVPAGGV